MARTVLIWLAVVLVASVPIGLAAFSPLLAWRQPVYIAAGFAGIVAMVLLVFQPLLMVGAFPGLSQRGIRHAHGWIGSAVLLAIVVHVVGLWVTSPPDVVDALLLRSPTPFSIWGVLAMWALIATAVLAVLRRRGRIRWQLWQRGHLGLGVVIIVGTIVHAVLIQGTMETLSKYGLSAVLVVSLVVLVLAGRRKRRRRGSEPHAVSRVLRRVFGVAGGVRRE